MYDGAQTVVWTCDLVGCKEGRLLKVVVTVYDGARTVVLTCD